MMTMAKRVGRWHAIEAAGFAMGYALTAANPFLVYSTAPATDASIEALFQPGWVEGVSEIERLAALDAFFRGYERGEAKSETETDAILQSRAKDEKVVCSVCECEDRVCCSQTYEVLADGTVVHEDPVCPSCCGPHTRMPMFDGHWERCDCDA